ncbi:formate dehydrogenase subunit delta [Mesorhizobium sp. WSM2239]|uniref:Formate dehydrogenase subunit delta n=2 Tax=unclassified Mesorhizobium TaxID=325217 RepID=A0AAU8DG86_9HYPH
MLHENSHTSLVAARIIRMANQIGTFFESKPRGEGVTGVAEHINKFWEPRMRRHFLQLIESGSAGFKSIVLEAAGQVRRPTEPVSSAENGSQADLARPRTTY